MAKLFAEKLNPAHDAAVKRMLAHPPQPKKSAKKTQKITIQAKRAA
jgi:hypothetical protein